MKIFTLITFENVIRLVLTLTFLSFIFTGGTTRQRTTDINNPNEPTTRNGKVKPPTVYKKDPNAGP